MNKILHSYQHQWLQPDWPHIEGVHALFTTRAGGFSVSPWDSLNLGDHVNDDPDHVAQNRRLLMKTLGVLSAREVQTVFMQQVHGCDVLDLKTVTKNGKENFFDACVCDQPAMVCTVMVADCLPVLMAHRFSRVVAAAHAGWRGLLGLDGRGVLETTWQAFAAKMGVKPSAELAQQTQVWLGPCIGPQAFEVGAEVRDAFLCVSAQASTCFTASNHAQDKWHASLPALARQRLHRLGLSNVYGNDASDAWCTYSNPALFFSHRRDAALFGSTGRMAACIWMD